MRPTKLAPAFSTGALVEDAAPEAHDHLAAVVILLVATLLRRSALRIVGPDKPLLASLRIPIHTPGLLTTGEVMSNELVIEAPEGLPLLDYSREFDAPVSSSGRHQALVRLADRRLSGSECPPS